MISEITPKIRFTIMSYDLYSLVTPLNLAFVREKDRND